MYRVSEVIIVEGRYDKNTVLQAVDATVIETGGFGIFNDSEKRSLLRRLAQERGLIILTDSDGAGFLIRNSIKGFIKPEYIKNAYIPDVFGKEKRKSKASCEGKLGVEGMCPEVIVEALRSCGATMDDCEGRKTPEISKADMYAAGLTGKPGSAEKRAELKSRLSLPEKLSTDGLLQVLNVIMTRDEFYKAVRTQNGVEL